MVDPWSPTYTGWRWNSDACSVTPFRAIQLPVGPRAETLGYGV